MTTPPPLRTVRRLAAATITLVIGLTAGSLLLAGPAAADVPELWPENEPVEPLHAILVLAGIPLLLLVAITVAVYVPSLIRGESLAPGGLPDDQWIGGPRPASGELAAPDTEASEAGGASGRW